MTSDSVRKVPGDADLWKENQELRSRLDEAEETLRAIRLGEIDGLIINGLQGEQVFTLVGADHPYRMLIEEMNEGALTITPDGTILYCNQCFAFMTNTPLQELIGTDIFRIIHPYDRALIKGDLTSEGAFARREIHLLGRSDTWLPVYCSIRPIIIEGMRGFAMVVTDLSEVKERASALRYSEERFRIFFDHCPAAMVVYWPDSRKIIDINPAFESLFKCQKSEIIDKTLDDVSIHITILPRVTGKGISVTDGFSQEMDVTLADGRNVRVLSSEILLEGEANGQVLASIIDITNLRHMESEIARLDRLNLIGEMAASIGHEIRNPMTSVRGFLQLFKGKENYEEDQVYLDLMIEELDRANDIISEYLGMAKDKPIDLQPTFLDDIVTSLYPMIQADANYNEMSIELCLCNPPAPFIDANEIRQLILNIARNGLEAMSSGGILTIGTAVDGEDIVLFIKDQGPGLRSDLIDRLGTPFLTTKEKGTGLGLAVCFSIAARHNARIDYDTGPNGTTFYMKFPMPVEQITLF